VRSYVRERPGSGLGEEAPATQADPQSVPSVRVQARRVDPTPHLPAPARPRRDLLHEAQVLVEWVDCAWYGAGGGASDEPGKVSDSETRGAARELRELVRRVERFRDALGAAHPSGGPDAPSTDGAHSRRNGGHDLVAEHAELAAAADDAVAAVRAWADGTGEWPDARCAAALAVRTLRDDLLVHLAHEREL